ncbi:hypothetical protein CEE69_13320 [Rhodopirellula bahusiensis]|uniref:Uncharacterized protein n=1 Tax=Rhodopirellula bahusiensis TaxID=2014065 RepID=A0A2G1W759_9BACT|nr:hypothetical protein CEE69_13320 [Rhodopirellula bahusiensis]
MFVANPHHAASLLARERSLSIGIEMLTDPILVLGQRRESFATLNGWLETSSNHRILASVGGLNYLRFGVPPGFVATPDASFLSRYCMTAPVMSNFSSW